MYRADIDGLRALAVLSVILFHFKIFPDYVGGGFVGVDIFFVISGYLITGIIFEGIRKGTYNLATFYDRRIRRIFPALISLYLVCAILTFLLNFPSEARTTGYSIIASTFFVSNIFFYARSGYFERDSETNPLLHTWSLSVEEQFYLLFPIIVFAIRTFAPGQKVLAIAAIALASFLYSAYSVYSNPSAAFYLVQFRAWELAVGSLIAIGAFPKISRPWLAEVVGATGLALVFGSFAAISRTHPFPGAAALAPCLGAAAIIYSGANTSTLAARLLSIRPLQFVGLISYSLYLVHWPAIVFFRLFHEPSRYEKIGLVIACIFIATLSWRFIERPFRVSKHRIGPKPTLWSGAVAMLFVATIALVLTPAMDVFWQYPTRAKNIMSYAKIDESHMRVGSCFLTSGYLNDFQSRAKDRCLAIRPGHLNYLLIGDSHAAHLWSGLQTAYPSVNFLQATASGCRPVNGEGGEEHCLGMIRYIFDEFLPKNQIDGVIISARWDVKDLPNLISTVTALRPFIPRIIVVGPIVQYVQPLPRILARAIMSNQPDDELAARYREKAQAETDERFAMAMATEGIEYISAYKSICDPQCVLWAAPDVPLQFDDDHLTRDGSEFLAKKFDLTFSAGNSPR